MQHDMPQTSTASVTSLRSHVLLCREGIPQALEDLYRAAEVGTIHEASWIVIHFLMLETGYICASEVLYNKLLYDSRYGEGKIHSKVNLRVISRKFLLVISMLCKTERS